MTAKYDRAIAVLLRRQSDAVDAGPDTPELRKGLVSAIDDAIAAGRAEAPHRFSRPGWAAVAAGVLLALGALTWWRSSQKVELPPGFRHVANLSGETHAGARLSWGPSTRFEVSADGASVLLRAGEVAAETTERELRIETTDAQVFTRGARVRVAQGAGCDGRTRVEVSAGVARVKAGAVDVTVSPGEVWPRCAATGAPNGGEPTFIAKNVGSRDGDARGSSPSAPPAAGERDGDARLGEAKADVAKADVAKADGVKAGEVKPGEAMPAVAKADGPKPGAAEPGQDAPDVAVRPLALAEQNRLFSRAIERQRAGDVRGAIALLDELLRAAPRSPLAEPALAQQLRWLEGVDLARAVEVARRYLRQYPMGSARADAERIVGP